MKCDSLEGMIQEMPKPGKGTTVIEFLLSKASKDMREALLPMILPAMATYLKGVRFAYSDGNWYEMCGQMTHLMAFSGTSKRQSKTPRLGK